ncbi:MAG: hypothetical protein KA109_07485 [Saprospiraceae bacterium]|jgi:hypothetical protein|nr:hypothetical protein [Saprospiraceae bacterium]MBK6479930.1 hypothetical protein [Saprospiraceae bacterium]MBK6815211.1 hypothetical protein [Saprospiraceae bacterium]MBK7372249.1 hypothetical protein [Saprospiraceae bacterium]MBK7435287.1 hypothetical protein [Saprospiraceae bacterium]
MKLFSFIASRYKLIFLIFFCCTLFYETGAQNPPREISATSFTCIVNQIPLKLNYFSSPALDLSDKKINRLVIVIHGNSRNPYTYHQNMKIAAAKAKATDRTLIMTPGLVMERDFNGNEDLLTEDHIFWTSNGWKQGDTSIMHSTQHPREAQISSFEIMDSLILRILSSGHFPNIRHIIVAGNSAGGQYVNRYCAGNLIHDKVKKLYGIEIKYLVAAPSTYTYLTPERPVLNTPGRFSIPADTSCNAGYDIYKYGLVGFNEYMNRTGADRYKSQLADRKVAYFVGALDNDPNDSSMDRTCPALLQGLQRRERAVLFMDYLQHIYGKRWKLTIVEGSAHDHAKMFASKEGMKWIFKS